jgi:hypothetical protein
MIVAILMSNTQLAKEIIKRLAPRLPAQRQCLCEHSLKHAIMTDLRLAPAETLKSLDLIVGKYRK